MKVLITVPCLQLPGGVANYYRILRPYLGEERTYLEIGYRPNEKGSFGAFRRLVADYWRFHLALRRGSYDLVHINPSMGLYSVVRDGLLLMIAKAHRLRVLVFFRGWNPDCAAIVRRFAWLFRIVYGRADAFIVLAKEFRQDFMNLGINCPIYLETTVVSDAAFEAKPPGELGAVTAEGGLRILFLSRLERGKGLLTAIDAFCHLRETWPSVTLVIAGDGPERATAEEIVRDREIGGVSFLGHVEGAEKNTVFRNSDIYLFTSVAEGMPNSVLESMAFGLPVVTRAVGGLRDFFADGRMGYATDSSDPTDFAELLDRLVSNPSLCRSIGEYNREYARARFVAPVVSTRLLGIYEQVQQLSRDH